MDIEITVRPMNSDHNETVILKNGVVMPVVSESAMDYVYRMVCRQIPTGYTVFKNYNPERKEWLLEVFDRPRDYQNEAIWHGRFQQKVVE